MNEPDTVRSHRWALGRRWVRSRPLAEEERAWLRSARRRAWIEALLALAAIPATVAVVVTGLRLAGLPLPAFVATAIGGLVPVAGLLAVGASLLVVRDRVAAAWSVAHDLRAGTAECFARPADGDVAPGPEDLVLATVSHRVLGAPGSARGERVRVAEVADGTENAFRVHHRSLPDGTEVERRRLTPLECEELRQAIARLRRPGGNVWIALAAFALFAGGFVSGARARATPPVGDVLSGVLVTGITVLVAWRYVRDVHRAHLMRRDLSDGVAMWVRPAHEGEPPLEVLPNSGVVWWAGNAPAAWRTLSRPR